jgi:enamine deaminase RidA (YjgF/YER057c/UK114 family)
MMHKLFNSYAPRAEKTLDETLIMKPKDFKMNFLNNVWRELVRVLNLLREAEAPRKVVVNAIEAVSEARTMIKDLFR